MRSLAVAATLLLAGLAAAEETVTVTEWETEFKTVGTKTTTFTPLVTQTDVTSVTVVFPPGHKTFTSTSKTTFYTSSPNATKSAPAVVPTAAAERGGLQASFMGLIAFIGASLIVL